MAFFMTVDSFKHVGSIKFKYPKPSKKLTNKRRKKYHWALSIRISIWEDIHTQQ